MYRFKLNFQKACFQGEFMYFCKDTYEGLPCKCQQLQYPVLNPQQLKSVGTENHIYKPKKTRTNKR